LQESADQFLRFFKVLQGKIDQQAQFQYGQLAPDGVFIEFDTDQRAISP
jgi:hypothetical protein